MNYINGLQVLVYMLVVLFVERCTNKAEKHTTSICKICTGRQNMYHITTIFSGYKDVRKHYSKENTHQISVYCANEANQVQFVCDIT